MQADRKFQITYTLTPWDYAAMTRAITRRPLQRSAVTLALWLFSVWCLLVLFTEIFNPITMVRAIFTSGSPFWVLAVLCIVVLFSVFSHWFAWAVSFFYFRQLASAGVTITMALTNEIVEGNSTVADTRAPWATVKRIVRERDYLFLPISNREAFILPRRGFASDTEFDAACRYAAERISASRRALA